ncbi:MAG: hypothetical protein A2172_04125 [Candidatus Woykebacteria bacterium RBG_13_40_15]|uniref:Uncharacterized protein n=1 Tax=Candidatus Woykebacteria bacterium RBG_13_40_15 TaxID=1802593 RepID=A0A1G1W7R3_9BACT|nr:MAG: hypothetical protein A2172_04125 [Candidatus Woykebacteria bacterium RBG_13_40_15]
MRKQPRTIEVSFTVEAKKQGRRNRFVYETVFPERIQVGGTNYVRRDTLLRGEEGERLARINETAAKHHKKGHPDVFFVNYMHVAVYTPEN